MHLYERKTTYLKTILLESLMHIMFRMFLILKMRVIVNMWRNLNVERIGKMSVQRRQALPIQRFLMFSVTSWNIRGSVGVCMPSPSLLFLGFSSNYTQGFYI